MLRLLTVKALQKEGLEVLQAGNGKEALSLFDQSLPDVVILDVMMPVMDGFSVCSEIRRHPRGMLVPVLMVTGLDDIESIRRAYEAGATDFATKPINWLVLGHRVRYMLRASRSIGALQKSEAKNRALLNAVPDLMLRMSRTGALLEFKQAKTSPVLTLTEQDIGRSIAEVLPAGIAREIISAVETVLEKGGIHVFEHRFVTNGATYVCESRIGPSGTDETLGIVRDITERTAAEKRSVRAGALKPSHQRVRTMGWGLESEDE
jgi:DNA-binding response OmpR family regulator